MLTEKTIESKKIIEVLKFLEYISNKTDNPHEWREACGLIKLLQDLFEINFEEYAYFIRKERTNKPFEPLIEYVKDWM